MIDLIVQEWIKVWVESIKIGRYGLRLFWATFIKLF